MRKYVTIIELFLLLAIMYLSNKVVGNVVSVSQAIFGFCIVLNLMFFHKELLPVVKWFCLIPLMILNVGGIWFQYTIYGTFTGQLPMNYYLLVDEVTGFAMIFILYISIVAYVKKAVNEMSFGTMEDFDYYIREFKAIMRGSWIIVLFTSVQLIFGYTEIRTYLLQYAPHVDSFSTKYLQYFLFAGVSLLVIFGHVQLIKDLSKEVQKKIYERVQQEETESEV